MSSQGEEESRNTAKTGGEDSSGGKEDALDVSYKDAWMQMIPGVAISLQVSFENFFNAMYSTSAGAAGRFLNGTAVGQLYISGANGTLIDATEILSVSVTMCTDKQEVQLRTIAFGFILLVGWGLMRWRNFKDGHCLLHVAVNVILVPAWLLSVSAFPLTCWIASGRPLTASEVKVVSFVRFFLVALVAPVLVALEVHKKHVPTALDRFLKLTDGTGEAATGGEKLPDNEKSMNEEESV